MSGPPVHQRVAGEPLVSPDHIDAAAHVARELGLAAEVFVPATSPATKAGGATALAALRAGAFTPDADERVVVVVCGSNCDPATVGSAQPTS